MFRKNFTFSDKIILSIIILDVLLFSTIPIFVAIGITRSCIFQIFVFLFLLLVNLNPTKQFYLSSIKINLTLFLAVSIILFFIISSFYINLEYNLELAAIAKLLLYPVVISFFFYHIPRLIYKGDLLFEKFLNFWLYIAFISIVAALLSMFLKLNFGSGNDFIAVGFYYSPNIFAFIFTFTIPIIVYKFIVKRISIFSFLFLLIPSLFCLLFTYSRAGYLGFITALAIQLYKRSKILFVTTMVALAFVISTYVIQFAQAKGNISVFSRAEVMYTGYQMIVNNGMTKFLWGYGVNQSRTVFKNELSSAFGFYRRELGPHNLILSLGIQFGMLLTFSVFAFILVLLFKASFHKNKLIHFNNAQRINLSVAIVAGIVAQCMFEDLVIYPEFFTMPLFLVFLGYLYCWVNNYKATL
ncbi:MAG: hypothetical protein QXG00_04435 [Candidatus Woesearchaeota archaeon]